MAALDFPNAPAVNQLYTAPNGVTYMWTGVLWASYTPSALSPVATPTYDINAALITDAGTFAGASGDIAMLISQGQPVFSRNFTAVDPTHPIEVDITLLVGAGGAAVWTAGALFIDGAAAAVRQNNVAAAASGASVCRVYWQGVLAAGAHTFAVRFGAAATAYVNGASAARLGAGIQVTCMTIREVGIGLQGVQGPPGVAGPLSGAWNQIGTLNPAGVASVDFTAIAATFADLQVLFDLVPATTAVSLRLQTYDQAGALNVGATDYRYNNASLASSGSAVNEVSTGAPSVPLNIVANTLSNDAAAGGVRGCIDFTNIQALRHARATYQVGWSMDTVATLDWSMTGSMRRLNANRITGLRLAFNAGNIASGKVTLLGRLA